MIYAALYPRPVQRESSGMPLSRLRTKSKQDWTGDKSEISARTPRESARMRKGTIIRQWHLQGMARNRVVRHRTFTLSLTRLRCGLSNDFQD
jgi:hypothetical protein